MAQPTAFLKRNKILLMLACNTELLTCILLTQLLSSNRHYASMDDHDEYLHQVDSESRNHLIKLKKEQKKACNLRSPLKSHVDATSAPVRRTLLEPWTHGPTSTTCQGR